MNVLLIICTIVSFIGFLLIMPKTFNYLTDDYLKQNNKRDYYITIIITILFYLIFIFGFVRLDLF